MELGQLQFLVDDFGFCGFEKFEPDDSLPLYFKKRYKIDFLKVGGQELAFLTPKKEFRLTEVKKDSQFCSEKLRIPAVFVLHSITAYQKAEMMKNHIQFVIPPTQVYLPNIGVSVSLRDEPKHQKAELLDTFSVATQRVFLSLLYAHDEIEAWTATDLSRQYDLSVMTASRIIREWVAAGIGAVQTMGNKKVFTFAATGKRRFDSAQKYLFSPVAREYRLNADLDPEVLRVLHPAGLTALSHWTMLNDDAQPTMAMTVGEYKRHEAFVKSWKAPKDAEQYVTLQIWKYTLTPEVTDVMCGAGDMDELSVVLSLRDLAKRDERVDIAIQEYLEERKW